LVPLRHAPGYARLVAPRSQARRPLGGTSGASPRLHTSPAFSRGGVADVAVSSDSPGRGFAGEDVSIRIARGYVGGCRPRRWRPPGWTDAELLPCARGRAGGRIRSSNLRAHGATTLRGRRYDGRRRAGIVRCTSSAVGCDVRPYPRGRHMADVRTRSLRFSMEQDRDRDRPLVGDQPRTVVVPDRLDRRHGDARGGRRHCLLRGLEG